MATSESTESRKKMEELKTLDEMHAKSNEYPNKVIAVLFNTQ